MFPHFVGVETETQRGPVTGLEVRGRVCGRDLMKVRVDTLVGVSSGGEVLSGSVERVQDGHLTLSSMQGRLSHPVSSI